MEGANVTAGMEPTELNAPLANTILIPFKPNHSTY